MYSQCGILFVNKISLFFRAECKSPPAVKSASKCWLGVIPKPTVIVWMREEIILELAISLALWNLQV